MSTLDQAFAAIGRGDSLTGLDLLFAVPGAGDDPRIALNRTLYAPARTDGSAIEEEIEREIGWLNTPDPAQRAIALYNLGCFALFQDDVFEARLRFEDVLELQPDHRPARHNLGFAHELMAEYEAAKAEYRRVLEQEPGFTLSRLSLGQLLLLEGDVEQGLHELRALLASDPGNMGAVLYLCRALLGRGGAAEVQEVRTLLDGRPAWRRFPDLRECHAYAAFLQGDLRGAEQEFRDLLAEDDRNLFARVGLIKALAAREAYEELRGHAERYHALSASPESKRLVDTLRAL
jgi:tetratricopeptide (TPR) repeat protein